MALAKGMDVKTLSSAIGHVSAATTLDIYSHVTSDMQRNSADKIDSHMGRKEPFTAHLRKYEEVPRKSPNRLRERNSSLTRAKYGEADQAGCIRSTNTFGKATIRLPTLTANGTSTTCTPRHVRNAKSCSKQ